MIRARSFKTTVSISIADGGEYELDAIIGYEFTPEEAPTREYPGHGASAEIVAMGFFFSGGAIVPMMPWLREMIERDETLQASLCQDAISSDEDARERAAEMRAEDRRLNP